MSLRFKLVLSLLFGYVLMASVLHWYWVPAYLEHERASFVAHQKEIILTLEPSIIPALLERDYANLYVALERTVELHPHSWLSLELQDTNGRRLYPLTELPSSTSNTLISIEHPLVDYEESLGKLTLVADWGYELDVQKKQVGQIELVALAVFGLIAVISLVLQSGWLLRPIRHLMDASQRLSLGDFDVQLPNASRDELGALTNAFNDMRTSIKKAQASLERALRKSKDSEARTQAILDSASDAIITVNDEGLIETFNKGAERVFLYSADSIVRSSICRLVKYEQLMCDAENKVNFSHLACLEPSQEAEGIRQNGQKFPLEMSVSEVHGSKPLTYIFTLHDISERKRNERLKDEFVSTVSHELRTPLTAINGAIGLVTGHYHKDLPEEPKALLSLAERNVDRLLLLISDILDMSKLESGAMEFNLGPTDVAAFVERIVAMNQTYADQFGAVYVIKQLDQAKVVTDEDRLGQVISNLLSNAAKFSPQDSHVEISVFAMEGKVRIDVRDYGPGIAEEFRERLFDKFSQHDSGNTRSVGGTGLGLSISRLLMAKLGGGLSFDSVEGEGSTFHVDLPWPK